DHATLRHRVRNPVSGGNRRPNSLFFNPAGRAAAGCSVAVPGPARERAAFGRDPHGESPGPARRPDCPRRTILRGFPRAELRGAVRVWIVQTGTGAGAG